MKLGLMHTGINTHKKPCNRLQTLAVLLAFGGAQFPLSPEVGWLKTENFVAEILSGIILISEIVMKLQLGVGVASLVFKFLKLVMLSVGRLMGPSVEKKL